LIVKGVTTQGHWRRPAIAVTGAVIAALALAAPTGAAAAKRSHKHPVVKVMTRNVYLGADLSPAINATSTNAFIDADGKIVRDVDTNNFPVRAKGLAHEILSEGPDLVGLQEVALWRTGPLNDLAPFTCTGTESDNPPFGCQFTASTVRYDYLKLLLAQLNKGKRRYRVVESNQEFDFEAPADINGVPGDGDLPGVNDDGEQNARLTMRDVVLAKVGSRIKTSHAEGGHFTTLYAPTVAGTLTVHVLRGWDSVDVKVGHSPKFRFVNTHLEAFGDPKIRRAQAKELVAKGGPADPHGKLPVILIGDLNSDDNTVSDGDRLAYKALRKAGYVERSTDSPLSCCLNTSILTSNFGSVKDFNHQVDHVLTDRPKLVKLVGAAVTGRKPVHGYWDSDHAGVFSKLEFRR
jgi:Endonuclease/Exonuclease/phosphatase family